MGFAISRLEDTRYAITISYAGYAIVAAYLRYVMKAAYLRSAH